MMHILTIIFPFLIFGLGKKRTKNTSDSMFIASLSCVILGIIGPDTTHLTVINKDIVLKYMKEVIFDNSPIYMSIFCLGFFMYLIEKSSIIELTRNSLNEFNLPPDKKSLFPAFFSLIFSADDYLLTSTSCFLSSSLLGNTKTVRKNVAVIVSLFAVSFCFISPMSSWRPVIARSIESAGATIENVMISYMPFNLTVIMMFLAALIWSKKLKQNFSYKSVKSNRFSFVDFLSKKGPRELFASVVVMVISYIVSSVFLKLESPLLVASICCNLFMIVLYAKTGLIEREGIRNAVSNTKREMSSIVILLYSIWTFVFVLKNIIGIGAYFNEILEFVKVPAFVMPAFIFISAAAFSFVTGSAYGSFGMFCILASEMSTADTLVLTVVAALGGSLFSLFSVASDITLLAADATRCEIDQIRKEQSLIAMTIATFSVVGYIMLGASSNVLFRSIIIALVYLLFYITLWLLSKDSDSVCKYCFEKEIHDMFTNIKTISTRNKRFSASKGIISLHEYFICWWRIRMRRWRSALRICASE